MYVHTHMVGPVHKSFRMVHPPDYLVSLAGMRKYKYTSIHAVDCGGQ